MRNFVFKIIFIIILINIVLTIVFSLTPFYFGNQYFRVKYDYLKENNRYNLLFFGSSRVNRQIDPHIFDSVFNLNCQKKIKSFNLGSPATFCPETYYLFENFLNSEESKNIEFCLIELMPINLINDFFYHKEQTNYWLNFKEIKFILKSINNNKQLSNYRKKKHIKRYIISYLENLFHIGHYGKQMTTRDYYNKMFLGNKSNGYFPMDEELVKTKHQEIKKHLLQVKNEISNDSALLVNRLKNAVDIRNNIYNDSLCDFNHLNRITNIIENSSKRGIKTIFFISPRNYSKELLRIYKFIPKNHKIDMGDPNLNSEFYLQKFSFDRGHLNHDGARIYSIKFAQEFKKIINEIGKI